MELSEPHALKGKTAEKTLQAVARSRGAKVASLFLQPILVQSRLRLTLKTHVA